MLNTNEEWKDILGFEGLYQASNLGRIKSLKRFRKGKNGSLAPVEERILKPQINSCGYYQVVLCKNSIQKFYLVHRLVWEAFNCQIPEGYEINHINEIKTDNRLSNLNLMTCKENNNWGTRIERSAKKQINGKRSKAVLQFDLQDNFIKEFPSAMQVERELGFANGNIVNCCKGKYKTAYNYKWKYKE